MISADVFEKVFFTEHIDSAALIMSETNRFYFSGFESSDGIVLLLPDVRYLIVDFRYYEIAKKSIKDFEVLLAEKSMLEITAQLCKKHGVSKIYIEDEYVTFAQYKRLEKKLDGFLLECLGDTVSKLRSVKTEQEINAIKDAQQITDAAFNHIINILHIGMTESEVATELEYFMRKNGAQGTAFKTISVSGKKSSLPHGEPDDILLTKDSFLTMDFGAKLTGYCSDMTRTVVLGRADDEMKFIYDTVLKSQTAALETVRAGVKGNEVDAAARNIIEKCGFGKCFGHATGHGLGIEVHESPSFSPRYEKEISLNSVLSVEPGIYIEDKYGVRIEDIVVVGTNNAVNLTHSTKKLLEID